MINLTKAMLLQHYKREDIQQAIFKHSQNREIAVNFNNKYFGKRPEILNYPRDVFEFVKEGVTSFHCSEELWKNPMQLNSEMKRKDQDNLRSGWDLLLDIDCPWLELSTIAAHYLVEAIKHHGVDCVTVKMSGNHGWHIAIPFEAFPETVNNVPTKNLFPEAPRAIASYLQEMVNRPLGKAILEKYNINEIQKMSGKKFNELIKNEVFNPFSILSIDTVLIASRHLYRMPYSFNEKSGLVSIPYDPKKILEFKKEEADYKNVVVDKFKFIERDVPRGEAKKLLLQALDFKPPKESIIVIKDKPIKQGFQKIQNTITEENFPPCMKKISQGMEDGKKRGLFAMINFLGSIGWDNEKMESYLSEWNKKNPEQLKEGYIIGQLRQWQKKDGILPPNCMKYYQNIHVCSPDSLCKKIKNPVSYSIRKNMVIQREKQKNSKEN